MPKWLIPIIIVGWVGGGIAAYYGYWIPVVVLLGLGILAATSAAGMLWANRSALRVAQQTISKQGAASAPKETAAEAAERRKQEVRKRQERNRKRRRK